MKSDECKFCLDELKRYTKTHTHIAVCLYELEKEGLLPNIDNVLLRGFDRKEISNALDILCDNRIVKGKWTKKNHRWTRTYHIQDWVKSDT